MGANSYRKQGLTKDLYNDIDLREWYADIKASDRVKFRLGKQQIVWGETDFFVANDLAQGYASATPSLMTQFIAPGFDGWKTKNVVASRIRMDKNFAFTQGLLGTEKPMFFSVQLFDKWIQNFDQNENLLYSVGWGGRVKRHNTLLTTIFDLSYDNGRLHPQLVLGSDVTNGGGKTAQCDPAPHRSLRPLGAD